MLDENAIRDALKAVKYPGYSRDIISFGLLKSVAVNGGAVSVLLQLTTSAPEIAAQLKAECERALRGTPGVQQVIVEVKLAPGQQPPPQVTPKQGVPGIKRIVAVASGKGGVGKSTVSVNLACALTHLGHRVGLLDCDIYGPSIPLMMGINERPMISEEEKLIPPVNHGVKLMSMGFLLNDDQPVIWRGPMIVKTIQQFVGAVDWGQLDFLLVDLPPGTGDAQLTLCQTVPLDGGVIVTTPQEASVGIVRKGVAMFQKLNVPILGFVENMSYFTAPGGERIEIFGSGGGRREATRLQAPFLGEIPIFPEIRVGGDKGLPVAVSAPEAPSGRAFVEVARALAAQMGA
jgi:ATP-binding protein involved in chromosome partitioning